VYVPAEGIVSEQANIESEERGRERPEERELEIGRTEPREGTVRGQVPHVLGAADEAVDVDAAVRCGEALLEDGQQ
jgi:hypothetical protein